MPSLDKNFFENISVDHVFTKYPIFIESGTFEGETTFEMDKYFEILHTIEIKEEFYEKVKLMYS